MIFIMIIIIAVAFLGCCLYVFYGVCCFFGYCCGLCCNGDGDEGLEERGTDNGRNQDALETSRE